MILWMWLLDLFFSISIKALVQKVDLFSSAEETLTHISFFLGETSRL